MVWVMDATQAWRIWHWLLILGLTVHYGYKQMKNKLFEF
jgi:hypothetical protein